MKIGFNLKWPIGQSYHKGLNVIGDELYAESMVKTLKTFKNVEFVELYAPNYLPAERLDILIYLNDNEIQKNWAKKNVLYMQNAYGKGSANKLREFQRRRYDGYAFISNKLLQMHKSDSYEGIFLPFGVDTTSFFPREKEKELTYDLAYIGNDIKGQQRTEKYLLPAVHYNFGLYGNWEDQLIKPTFRWRWKLWKNFTEPFHYKKAKNQWPLYKEIFRMKSLGKIPQDKVPVLYSSAKINLNCTHQDCVDWDVITLRTFEVLACKGFLITDKVPIAEQLLKDCMVFTDGDNDLTEKIDYYLDHVSERIQIAENGYNYVIQYADIKSRMQELLVYLESIR